MAIRCTYGSPASALASAGESPFSMRYLAISLSIIAMVLATPARADVGECYISVDGQDLLTGPCLFGHNDKVMAFKSVSGSTIPESQREVIVLVSNAREAVYIADPIGRDPYREILGRVEMTDACWVNERVRICAWALEETPPAQDRQR